ncbi:RNA polymerase II subunit 5-mediating protein homolog [Scylla paramamosain]|uniref:RNA polymerase II subunit 5-mediating protein homolog n=1 Tax=Scylla paramamosain TaxID=85552 RepID=UPI00308383C3
MEEGVEASGVGGSGGLRPTSPSAPPTVTTIRENLANLLELKRVHQERLEKVEDELSKLQKYKKDYEHLLKRLKTLPDKITHEVMVPLGTLAVVPGQLIHTNEVLVLLGDNWFAERSAKQAIHIVRRRIKDCEDKIRSCEETQRIHLGWLKEAEEVLQGEQGDQVEIIEEMTEEEYQRSQEEHRRRVKAQYTQLTESSTCHPASPPSPPSPPAYVEGLGEGGKRSYEDLMRRLDQLEVEELGEGMEPLEEEDEEEEEEEEEDEEEEDEDEAFTTGTASDADAEKAVTFKPRLRLHSAEAGGCVEEDRAPTDDTDDESSQPRLGKTPIFSVNIG